ncbi:Heme-degrading monooxygenase HmoA [Paenibacillaceae bacterium GAS479]|nr:Heme-degrading monooxygenase HmoA [Paenibacillaceae bacterium GAS479]
MIVVTNTIQIKSGYGEQFAERFKNPKGVHKMPGFVSMELLLSRGEEADELKVVTHWVDKASFDNWVSSDSFKQAHARPASASSASSEQPPVGAAQPMGGTAVDGNPVDGATAAETAGAPAGAGAHGGAAGSAGGQGAGEYLASRAEGAHAAETANAGEHAAHSHPSGTAGPHAAHGQANGAAGAAAAGTPNPRELMLGAKLSVHEVLFTLGTDKL